MNNLSKKVDDSQILLEIRRIPSILGLPGIDL